MQFSWSVFWKVLYQIQLTWWKHLFWGSATRAAYNWYRALLYRHDAAMFVCLIGSLPTWHSAVCSGNIFNIVFYKNTMEIHRNQLLNCGQKNLTTSSGTSVGTAVTNPPVVFPNSSCDVHLLRSPWSIQMTTLTWNEKS